MATKKQITITCDAHDCTSSYNTGSIKPDTAATNAVLAGWAWEYGDIYCPLHVRYECGACRAVLTGIDEFDAHREECASGVTI